MLPNWLDCCYLCYLSHTHPGSLKTYIYEGVRDTSLSNESVIDIRELVSADVVLTTYDVLKEDLSHDSDRHEGDRRLMRFQKRFSENLRCLVFFGRCSKLALKHEKLFFHLFFICGLKLEETWGCSIMESDSIVWNILL